MDKQVVAEMLTAFVKGGQRVEKMAKGDPVRIAAERIGNRFTEGVGMLKGFPNQNIRALMSMVWDIVGHRIVPVALGPSVPSLTFGAMGQRDAIIFVPHWWEKMIEDDPVCQLGAVVFVGSQAVDYYNDRIVREAQVTMMRSRAYEAEYLVTVKEYTPAHVMNDWQKQMLGEFPKGLHSENIKEHLYKHKAFVRPA